MFSNGEFTIPMFVHDQVPPGGRVRIKTTNVNALKAIHDFLLFQIEDHHTGNATDIGTL